VLNADTRARARTRADRAGHQHRVFRAKPTSKTLWNPRNSRRSCSSPTRITPSIHDSERRRGSSVAAPDAQLPVLPIAVFCSRRPVHHQVTHRGRSRECRARDVLLVHGACDHGVSWIVKEPQVMWALDPTRGLRLSWNTRLARWRASGVFLTVTAVRR